MIKWPNGVKTLHYQLIKVDFVSLMHVIIAFNYFVIIIVLRSSVAVSVTL